MLIADKYGQLQFRMLVFIAGRMADRSERPYVPAVESGWNVILHGDAPNVKWTGNWRMEWVANTLHTTSEHGVSSVTTADAHTSAASSRLNRRPPADLNALVRFAERRNLISARVPSHFNWPLQRCRFTRTMKYFLTFLDNGSGTVSGIKYPSTVQFVFVHIFPQGIKNFSFFCRTFEVCP